MNTAFLPRRGFTFVTCFIAFSVGVIYGSHRAPIVLAAAQAKKKAKEEEEKKEREHLKSENLQLKQQIERAKRYFGEAEFEHAIASEEKTRAAPEQGETPQSLFDPELLNRITPEETNVLVGKWIRVLEEKPEEVVDKGSQ